MRTSAEGAIQVRSSAPYSTAGRGLWARMCAVTPASLLRNVPGTNLWQCKAEARREIERKPQRRHGKGR